jgi:hypothetical protein
MVKFSSDKEKPVSIHTKYLTTFVGQSTNAQFVAVPLAPNAGGLGTYSSQINNYIDMYRMARIDKIVVRALNTAGTNNTVPSWVLFYQKYGGAAPANFGELESTQTSSLAALAGTLTTTEANRTVLKIEGPDMTVVESAEGPGLKRWISTQSDSGQNNWGNIYVVFSSTSVATTNFFIDVEIWMSFYQMMDPASISRNIKARALPTPSTDFLPPRVSSPEAEITESQLLLDRLLKKYPKSTL